MKWLIISTYFAKNYLFKVDEYLLSNIMYIKKTDDIAAKKVPATNKMTGTS
jgi:hypothetical protein